MAAAVVTAVFMLAAAVLALEPLGVTYGQNPPQTRPQPQKPQKPPDDPPPQDKETVLKIGQDLVTLDVTVLDAAGNKPVLDLRDKISFRYSRTRPLRRSSSSAESRFPSQWYSQ
jgi:hypothetical protein